MGNKDIERTWTSEEFPPVGFFFSPEISSFTSKPQKPINLRAILTSLLGPGQIPVSHPYQPMWNSCSLFPPLFLPSLSASDSPEVSCMPQNQHVGLKQPIQPCPIQQEQEKTDSSETMRWQCDGRREPGPQGYHRLARTDTWGAHDWPASIPVSTNGKPHSYLLPNYSHISGDGKNNFIRKQLNQKSSRIILPCQESCLMEDFEKSDLFWMLQIIKLLNLNFCINFMLAQCRDKNAAVSIPMSGCT